METKMLEARQRILSKRAMRWIPSIAMVLISLAILGFLVYRQREMLAEYEWKFNLYFVALSFVLFSFILFMVANMWGVIMKALGSEVNRLKHIKYYCLSNVTKRIPGTIWYVVSRAHFYKSDGVDYRLTSLASGIELATIVLAGILVSLTFGIPIIFHYHVSLWLLGVALVISAAALHPKVIARVFRIFRVAETDIKYKNILSWLFIYSLAWILGGIVLFLIGNVVTNISIQQIGYFIGGWSLVGVLSTTVFFLPTNMGITEIGLSLVLSNIMPSSIAVIIAILARLLMIFFEVIWAAAWLTINVER
ncbi:MAG TPA: hypothetical protein VE136_04155 [Anaerolineales bacterium]|nr:hypothetical protein [Anaerolineales bacterium]